MGYRGGWDPEYERKRARWMAIVVAIAVSGFVGLILWLAIPRQAHAEVVRIFWEYTTNIRQKTLAHSAEWGHPGSKCDAPGFCEAPFDVRCERRLYDYEQCMCHDCHCRRDEDGHRSCDRCCSTCPVYRDWCSYAYYRWPVVQTERTSGIDHEVRWPGLMPSREDQRAERLESYEVAFREVEGERTWSYHPGGIGDFKRFSAKDPWELKVRPVGDANPIRLLTAEAESEGASR